VERSPGEEKRRRWIWHSGKRDEKGESRMRDFGSVALSNRGILQQGTWTANAVLVNGTPKG
jgi:hypothetical protein